MELDPALLSRIQFAANISFHIMFPTITISLGWILLFFKLRFNATDNPVWMQAYFFFTKVFALSFAIGVVTGLTMSFQFGTNWPGYMATVGNIAGPLLAYEILTAFFLEATFLGIMLFGFRKVPSWVHTGATLLVAVGTTISAFWILALNSWMQTPAGFEMIANDQGQLQAHVTSWMDVIFNPSMPYRLTHMLLASAATAAFVVAGVSAYRLLKGDQAESVKKTLKTGLILASIVLPLQVLAGHEHGINTKAYQPAKLAAMEGAWETHKGAPLVLFGWPDEDAQKNHFSIEIPALASLIVTHSLDGEIKGLKEFDVHPPVKPVFFSFRIMVGLGFLMLGTAWLGSYFLWKKQSMPNWYLIGLTGMTFSGVFATLAGWYVTEIGRQPWLVQGVLLTKDAVGPVGGEMVLGTLLVYLSIYVFLGFGYVKTIFYLAKKASLGNDAVTTQGAKT
ncbi:cytochrome ubiquinol oxidase subunit I [Terasakiella pusilla]|uniref:cytochrome ubiquinol oxidase subunit I n=1 Tax=Terasakiella pusilla TaxID=64973 RepID=UPI003AA8A0FE